MIPLYNEEANIDGLVSGMTEVLASYPQSWELLLVDNGSRDTTADRVRAHAASDERIRLVQVPVNQGYGHGVLSGMAAATGEIVGYIDGDLQISSADLAKILRVVGQPDADVWKARRDVRHDGPSRYAYSTAYNLLFRGMFGTRVRDVNAKPKFVRAETLRAMGLRSKDWFIDAELILAAERLGLRITEVDVTFHARRAGKSNIRLSTLAEFARNMLRARTRS